MCMCLFGFLVSGLETRIFKVVGHSRKDSIALDSLIYNTVLLFAMLSFIECGMQEWNQDLRS